MKNLLTLHEAIAVVLLSKPDRTATLQEISEEIENRRLFIRPSDGEFPPPDQIRLRTYPTTNTGKGHQDKFEFIKPNKVRLR